MDVMKSDSTRGMSPRRAFVLAALGAAGAGTAALMPATAKHPLAQRAADPNEPFAGDIAWLVANGLFDPAHEGSYLTEEHVTREDAAVYLYRLAGSPQRSELTLEPYRDVTPTSRSYREIMWVRGQAIMFGEFDATFQPTELVSRGHMCALLARMLHVHLARHLAAGGVAVPVDVPRISDVPEEHHYARAIEWARSSGLLGRQFMRTKGADATQAGVGTLFAADEPLTLGEFAYLMHRANALFE